MASTLHRPDRNRFLSKLTNASYQRLKPKLEEVSLRQDQVLYAVGDRVSHVYFPTNAIVSLLMDVDESRSIEVAMEGNEAVVGLAIHLGGMNRRTLTVVRHAGTAMRLPVGALTEGGDQHRDLAHLQNKYIHALLMQIAQAGVCSRFHSFDARLARWLLMTQDRTGSVELNATQISIAKMLGVRRSTVTDAASRLLKQNLIHHRRGHIAIVDRVGLTTAACSCYGTINREYDRVLD